MYVYTRVLRYAWGNGYKDEHHKPETKIIF